MKVQKLNEDKVVKFNNEVYPSYGWCVIMCGAPASGKSTALHRLIPIDAQIFDVDNLKSMAVDDERNSYAKAKFNDDKMSFLGKEYDIDDDVEEYTLDNNKFVSFLHKSFIPLNNKIQDRMFKIGNYNNKENLPNVAFDITGDKISKFDTIISKLKPFGYKFCIVWVFNTLEASIQNNDARSRKVLKEILINKYYSVLVTIPKLLRSTDIIKEISDFWVVLPVDLDFPLNSKEGRHQYVKAENVKRIPIEDCLDGKLPSRLTNMIFESQREILQDYYNDEEISQVQSNYDKVTNYIEDK